MAATQKQIVKVLDRAARRAGENAATSKQTWFLAGLYTQMDPRQWEVDEEDFLLRSAPLTKREASDFIDMYLKQAA
jgi:hypothetical protein